MATYGKRKKRLLSSFNVFQDEKPEQDSNDQRSAYTRLGKAKSLLQRSRSHVKLDDESSDELTTNALLYNVPSLPREPIRLPSLHSLGAIATEDILRPKTAPEESEKPLPPVPKDPFAEQRRHWKSRTALAMKTTNTKSSASEAKPSNKPRISAPISLNSPSSASAPISSRPTTSHTTASVVQTSTADAVSLNTKISNLMAQATLEESQSKQKAAIYAAESAKLSPMERGRNAFVKATRAIKERFNSGSRNDKASTSRRPSTSHRSVSQESEPPPYETPEDVRRRRLDRRIAEGQNLSNPKIRKLTGDGNIPRKPLPVYESMKSRSHRSETSLLDDPFSDGKGLQDHLYPPDYSGFDFDFSNRKNKGKSIAAALPTEARTQGPPAASDQHLAVSGPMSGFCNMTSGLAQHSNAEIFSSSPVGHSTPRTRLDPLPPTKASKRPQDALARSPSVLEFSFEAPSDGVSSSAPSPKQVASEGSSLSVKRKGATDDLRSQLAPAKKRIKADSIASCHQSEDLGITTAISMLDTSDERFPLSPKSTNSMTPKLNRSASKARRGFSIFDVGKGKAPEGKEDDLLKAFKPRANTHKRSSLPRPNSVLFGRGRESRPGLQRLSSVDAESMDVDELQMDDAAYQIGSKTK